MSHLLHSSPVIFTLADKVQAHALVAVGYAGSKIEIINPCAQLTIDFGEGGGADSGVCQVDDASLETKESRRAWANG
ncbi:MAG TPA: hypothetical protein VNN80_06885 [Polyangiaceae bacterium]|nr:hypothetical protein [Polyangiaceae bacterium]